MSEGPSTPARTGHPHLRRAFLGVSASISALVMVTSAVGMGTYFWVSSQRQTIAAGSLDDGDPGGTPQVDIAGRCDTRACNYLLLGSDDRAGPVAAEQERSGRTKTSGARTARTRSSWCTPTPRQRATIVRSFPRDLWVEIPGAGMDKINSAFEGGVQGKRRAPRREDGAEAHRDAHRPLHVRDLAGFEGVVDALGGVRMCVPFAMQDIKTGLNIRAGCQRFRRDQTALAFVRTRSQPCDTIPDFARIGRQQQFFRAVLTKLLSPSELVRLPDLVGPVAQNLVKDSGFGIFDMLALVRQLGGRHDGRRRLPRGADGRRRRSTTVPAPYGIDVVKLTPDSYELFRALKNGTPLGDLGKRARLDPDLRGQHRSARRTTRARMVRPTTCEKVVGESGFNVGDGVVLPLDDLGGADAGLGDPVHRGAQGHGRRGRRRTSRTSRRFRRPRA